MGRCRCSSTLTLILVIALTLTSSFLYVYGVSFRTRVQFVEGKPKLFLSFGLSVASAVLDTFVLLNAQTSDISRRSKYLVCVCWCLLGLFLWFYDQLDTKGDFGYGHFASRGWIVLYVLGMGLAGVARLLYRLVDWLVGFIVSPLWLFGILCSPFWVNLGYSYLFRRQIWDSGPFGLSYTPMTSDDCRIDNDVWLLNRLLPKHFVQPLLGTYWCDLQPLFVSVERHNNSITVLDFDRSICLAEELTVRLIPRIHPSNYAFSEVRRVIENVDAYPFTHLAESIQTKKVTKLVVARTDFPMFVDGSVCETMLVDCGNGGMTNLATMLHPRGTREVEDSPAAADSEAEHLPNVYLIFIDSESRKSFEYDFPETLSVIESFRDDYELLYSFAHTVIGSITSEQWSVLFNGQYRKEKGTPIWKYAEKQHNYVSGWSLDECSDFATLNNDNFDITTHLHLEPFCISDFTDIHNPFNPWSGPISSARKCLFQKEAGEYVLDFGRQFIELYSGKNTQKKWLFLGFDDAHEASSESVRYLDEPLSAFMEFLLQKTDENNLIILFSDHDNHLSIIDNMNSHPMNPFLMILSSVEAPQANSHRLITMYDIFVTLWEEMELTQSDETEEEVEAFKFGVNILREELPKDRNCHKMGVRTKCQIKCQ